MKLSVVTGTERESSEEFHQHMINAMSMSYITYGPVRAAFPEKVNALDSLMLRLKKYKETGNKEFLVDVANFAMIEFMFPNRPDAYFEATDFKESPGRVWHGSKKPTSENNKGEPK
jgi:hypothetical protein